ncbi:hypothetical protein LXL04_005860 [Taraxacum kok-saghyz]
MRCRIDRDHLVLATSFQIQHIEGYLALFEDLCEEILQTRLKLDAKIKEANEKFPNNLEISEWRPRLDGFFGFPRRRMKEIEMCNICHCIFLKSIMLITLIQDM